MDWEQRLDRLERRNRQLRLVLTALVAVLAAHAVTEVSALVEVPLAAPYQDDSGDAAVVEVPDALGGYITARAVPLQPPAPSCSVISKWPSLVPGSMALPDGGWVSA